MSIHKDSRFFEVKIKSIEHVFKEIFTKTIVHILKKTKNTLQKRLKFFSKERKIFAVCYLIFVSIQKDFKFFKSKSTQLKMF